MMPLKLTVTTWSCGRLVETTYDVVESDADYVLVSDGVVIWTEDDAVNDGIEGRAVREAAISAGIWDA